MTQEKAYRVLIVEDERSIRDGLKLNLELEGYETIEADNGKRALDILRSQKIDLAILDVMLPQMDGFTVCKTIRLEGNTTPVLFLTAKGTSSDVVEGLKIGGDDYLAKPFNLEELLLRAQKLIFRKDNSASRLSEMDSYRFDGMEVDFNSYEVLTKDGERKQISKKEVMLLKLLIQKKGEAVSREEILETVWGYDVYPSTRTIDNFITSFRKYFEPNPKQPIYFFSVRGVGYKFSPR